MIRALIRQCRMARGRRLARALLAALPGDHPVANGVAMLHATLQYEAGAERPEGIA